MAALNQIYTIHGRQWRVAVKYGYTDHGMRPSVACGLLLCGVQQHQARRADWIIMPESRLSTSEPEQREGNNIHPTLRLVVNAAAGTA